MQQLKRGLKRRHMYVLCILYIHIESGKVEKKEVKHLTQKIETFAKTTNATHNFNCKDNKNFKVLSKKRKEFGAVLYSTSSYSIQLFSVKMGKLFCAIFLFYILIALSTFRRKMLI